ncbi:hypothetical protein AWV79_33685 [Cupriavidus sp. UYMMa02A]|nr:hypothetical protein AWV79_33685 [Cupriavidus sp. UYMMa02A]
MSVSPIKFEVNEATLLDSTSAGLHGVLALLEIASERSEDCYAARCLLALLKTRIDDALQGTYEGC